MSISLAMQYQITTRFRGIVDLLLGGFLGDKPHFLICIIQTSQTHIFFELHRVLAPRDSPGSLDFVCSCETCA